MQCDFFQSLCGTTPKDHVNSDLLDFMAGPGNSCLFSLTSSLADTPGHLWVHETVETLSTVLSLILIPLELQNKRKWVTGQLEWIRALSPGHTSVSLIVLSSLSLSPSHLLPHPQALTIYSWLTWTHRRSHPWVLGLKVCSIMSGCYLMYNMLYFWHLNPLSLVTP